MQPIDPFENVDNPAGANQVNQFLSQNGQLQNINTIAVGTQNTSFHMDRNGIWLGSTTFTKAPFSVDMQGHLLSTISPNDQVTSSAAQTGISSASYVDVTAPQIVFTADANRTVSVLVFGTLTIEIDSGAGKAYAALTIDGVSVANEFTSALSPATGSFLGIASVTPGSHTLKFQIKNTGGSGTVGVTGLLRTIGYIVIGVT